MTEPASGAIFIDLGNSALRLASFADGRLAARAAMPTDAARAHPERLRDLFASFARPVRPAGGSAAAWIASVAPDVGAAVGRAAAECGWTPRFVRPTDAALLPHRLATPRTTGVDRLLAALAAWTLAGEDAGESPEADAARGAGLIVVQAGTAATVDWVDGGGVFRGGAILPGPALWRAGLARAAQIPDDPGGAVDWTRAEAPLGDGTAAALAGGLAAGLTGAAANTVAALSEQARREGRDGKKIPPRPPVVATGGWAAPLADACRAAAAREGTAMAAWRVEPDLVLHGLRAFAGRDRLTAGPGGAWPGDGRGPA